MSVHYINQRHPLPDDWLDPTMGGEPVATNLCWFRLLKRRNGCRDLRIQYISSGQHALHQGPHARLGRYRFVRGQIGGKTLVNAEFLDQYLDPLLFI